MSLPPIFIEFQPTVAGKVKSTMEYGPKILERRVAKWISFTPPGITAGLSCFGLVEASAA